MDINNKIEEIILLLENSREVKKYKQLKKEIMEDEEIKKELLKFKEEKNIYSPSYVEAKKKIITNKKVKEFKKYENELYFLALDINRKLKKVNTRKKCMGE